jgi:hypothetical protein
LITLTFTRWFTIPFTLSLTSWFAIYGLPVHYRKYSPGIKAKRGEGDSPLSKPEKCKKSIANNMRKNLSEMILEAGEY